MKPHRPVLPCRRPISPILVRDCTKEFARGLMRRGAYKAGCIWFPKLLADRPEIGDLYAPDPAWRQLAPVEEGQPAAAELNLSDEEIASALDRLDRIRERMAAGRALRP